MQEYTPTQEKQIKFLERMVEKEIRIGFSAVNDYHVSCKDCDESRTFHAPESAQRFISRHAGHRTWVENSGFYKPSSHAAGYYVR